MEKNLLEKLKKLSSLSQNEIGENENSVKYKFIIPFLECFGYSQDLDFEHSSQGNRIDIFIDSVATHKIVIEAKAYNKNLDDFVSQLKKYCDDKRPILAIISNGEDIRFYSPLMRISEFSETLLYAFKRGNLKDEDIITRIEKILSKENLQNETIDDFIREREDEIKKAKNEIKSAQTSHKGEFSSIENEINELNQQIQTLQNIVNQRQQEILELEISKKNEIENLYKKYLMKTESETKEKYLAINISENNHKDTSELPKYVKQRIPSITNHGTIPFEMLTYIKQNGPVTWNDLEKTMTEKFGYTENSGSISGSYNTLLWLDLIRNDGKKSKGKIFFVKDYTEK